MHALAILRSGALSLLATATIASTAGSAPLQCQARGQQPQILPPVLVAFEALVDGGALPYSFQWDFGDGGASGQSNPSHLYSGSGIYSAVLTVTDGGSPAETCRDTVVLYVGYVVDPFCSAGASTRWGEAPLAVTFAAMPALVFDPPPYSWSWTFGDGGTGSGATVGHTYATPGTRWAVATLHTPIGSYPCLPTLRLSATSPVADVAPIAGERGLRLEPPSPNPFRALTALAYQLPSAGRVRIQILDPAGRVVARLLDGHRDAGRHLQVWQGRFDGGASARPGIFFARVEHDGVARQAKVVRVE